MPPLLRSLTRAAVAALILLGLDGCLYRDPGVTLSNGYEIGANSHSSPCVLQYQVWDDKRSYGPWTARVGDEQDGPGSPIVRTYTLYPENASAGGEIQSFESEDAFRAACRLKQARMERMSPLVDDVKRFDADASFIIGEYGGGYFLLDIAENWIETWSDRTAWAAQVRTRTSLDPDRLRNPKSFWLKTRDTGAWIAYAVVLSMFVPWIIAPLRWRKYLKQPEALVNQV